MSRRKVFRLVFALGCLSLLATPAPAIEPGTKICSNHRHHRDHHSVKVPEVKQSMTVNAKPEHVWEAIQHERKGMDRTLLSYDGKEATIDEKFASLPIVGAATCTYIEKESSTNERIDYALLRSDRFIVFQGSWIISPGKDGSSTVVELSNAIDPGIRVPFWQDITKLAAHRMIKRRLESVTAYAEKLHKGETLIR